MKRGALRNANVHVETRRHTPAQSSTLTVRASFRYAFLICPFVACLSTPSASYSFVVSTCARRKKDQPCSAAAQRTLASLAALSQHSGSLAP